MMILDWIAIIAGIILFAMAISYFILTIGLDDLDRRD
jgi:sensor domain CHASE-containing protein